MKKINNLVFLSALIMLPVPFTSQAPTLAWSNPRFQDACEEASVLMAMKWVKGEIIPKSTTSTQAIANEILKISKYTEKKYGTYHDTSAKDTADWIIKDYYNYKNFVIKNKVEAKDIISALEKGKIIIVPTNGKLLKNPNFTAGGPEHHMLLIKGYDSKNQLFITNDPGTKKGESYKYPVNTLYNAISDYPTGYHLSAKNTQKTAIIISK